MTTVLCFWNFGGSAVGTVAVAAVCYVLWGMSYTVYDIPIWAISSVSSHDADEKNGMVTLGKIGGTLGTVIVSVGSVALLNAFGGERSASAYAAAAATIAGVGALFDASERFCAAGAHRAARQRHPLPPQHPHHP